MQSLKYSVIFCSVVCVQTLIFARYLAASVTPTRRASTCPHDMRAYVRQGLRATDNVAMVILHIVCCCHGNTRLIIIRINVLFDYTEGSPAIICSIFGP